MLKRYKMYYNEAVGKIEMIGEPDYDVGGIFRIWIIYNKDIGNFVKLREYLKQ